MQRIELEHYTCALLDTARFRDYRPNGLQIQGRAQVQKIVTGVSASLALIEQAIQRNADAILVHHGYFWKNEDARIVGVKQTRIKALLAHDISLFGFHLPLDAHPTLGNNVQLGQRLGFQLEGCVAWVNRVRENGDNPNPGMGIRFVDLQPDERERLVEVIRTIAYLRDLPRYD